MKKNFDLKSMLLGAFCIAVILISAAAAADRNTAWEYKVITGAILRPQGAASALDYKINDLVSEGWQFVSASSVGEASGFAVMRRPKP